MSCKEIAENVTYTTELIREIKAQTFRYFLALIISIVCCLALVGYVFYDRYLDSLIEVEATQITQDGLGYNTYVNGVVGVPWGRESRKRKVKGIVEEKDNAHCYYLTFY